MSKNKPTLKPVSEAGSVNQPQQKGRVIPEAVCQVLLQYLDTQPHGKVRMLWDAINNSHPVTYKEPTAPTNAAA